MTIRMAVVRALQFVTVAALLLGPAITLASKVPKPPSDLTGTWTGTYKAGSDRGTISLLFSQTADTGVFTGAAYDDSGGILTITGGYTMDGRKLATGNAFVDDGSGGTGWAVTGKASKTNIDLKLTFKAPGEKAKVTLTLN